MKNFYIPLIAGLLVLILENDYDNFLLWLYDNNGILPFFVRYFAVIWLIEYCYAWYVKKKAQTATGDNAA